MLRHLNKSDFSMYGHMLKDFTPQNSLKKHIVDTYIKTLTSFDMPTTINVCSGLCVLCIFDSGNLISFLLDKPVEIRAGCMFALSALEKECEVQIYCKGNKMNSLNLLQELSPWKNQKQLTIHDIVTFFYHDESLGIKQNDANHDLFELAYVERGSAMCIVDSNEYTLNQGELMLFFPHQTHVSKKLSDVSSFLTISFHMSEYDCDFLKNKVFRADLFIKNTYSRILSEYELSDTYTPDMLIACLYEILLHLMRQNTEPSYDAYSASVCDTDINTSKRTIKNISNYIDSHIDEKLSLSDISNALMLNPTYVSRIFKQSCGICVTKYIRQKKLNKAKQLLKSSSFTITEISDMLGFSSIHYFSSCFKKEFGLSPGAYADMTLG